MKLSLTQLKANADLFYSKQFWSSTELLEKYCNAILSDNGLDSFVAVKFSKSQAYVHQDHTKINHVIHIPFIDFSESKPQEEINHDVVLRSSFLRHELAHILYSDFAVLKDPEVKINNQFLLNCLEDTRIEYLFGKKYSGSNDPIFATHDFFHEKNRPTIENTKLSVSALGLYILSRSKGSEFDSQNEKVKIYESLFQKYKNFYLAKNVRELIPIANDLFDELKAIKESQKKDEIFKREIEEDFEEQVEKESDESEYSDGAPNFEDSDSEEKEISQESSEDLDQKQESKSSEKTDSKESSKQSEKETDLDDEIDNKNIEEDFSNFLSKEIDKKQKENFEQQLQETKKDLETLKKDAEQLEKLSKDDKDNFEEIMEKLCKTIDDASDIIDKNDETTPYSESLFQKCPMHPMDDYYSIIRADEFNAAQNLSSYREIVTKNNKVINDAINYLKIKFQAKQKTKTLNNKEEGLLDSYNLSKIFANDYSVFHKKIESIVDKSHVCLLVDHSGSMDAVMKETITSLIVFNEILSRLNIPRSIYFFTSSPNCINIPSIGIDVSKLKQFDSIVRNFGGCVKSYRYSAQGLQEYIVDYPQFDQEATGYIDIRRDWIPAFGKEPASNLCPESFLYRIRKMEERDDRKTERLLGLISRFPRVITSGGTPEPNAFYTVYKMHDHLSNKKFFIVNDGCYSIQKNTRKASSIISNNTGVIVSDDAQNLRNRLQIDLMDELSKNKKLSVKLKQNSAKSLRDKLFETIEKNIQLNIPYYQKQIENKIIQDNGLKKSNSRYSSETKIAGGKKQTERFQKLVREHPSTIALNKVKRKRNEIVDSIVDIKQKNLLNFNLKMGFATLSFDYKDGVVSVKIQNRDEYLQEFLTEKEIIQVTQIVSRLDLVPPNIFPSGYNENGMKDLKQKIGQTFYDKNTIEKNLTNIDKARIYSGEKMNSAAGRPVYDTRHSGFYSADRPFDVYYQTLIEKMRKSGWYVGGFGIGSDVGRNYIGVKNFEVLDSVNDIKDNFSKKLRNII